MTRFLVTSIALILAAGTAVAEPLIALITTIEADLPAVLEARKVHDDCA